MSCKKWEESIYLYQELSAKEQELVNIHVERCAKCQAIFENAQQLRSIITTASDYKAAIKDPVLLTNTIIKGISASSHAKPGDVITTLMDSWFTRYALGGASMLLVFFFMTEQQRPMEITKMSDRVAGNGPKVPLQSSAFIKAMVRESAKPKETSFYDCAKSNQCDYGIVRKYKQKRNHENS